MFPDYSQMAASICESESYSVARRFARGRLADGTEKHLLDFGRLNTMLGDMLHVPVFVFGKIPNNLDGRHAVSTALTARGGQLIYITTEYLAVNEA
jgi:hypothetical protein